MRAVALLALALASTFAGPINSPRLRVDDAVVPTHYAAELTIVPDQDRFDGSIDIEVTVARNEPVIWLNALDINVHGAMVDGHEAQVVAGAPGFIGLETASPLAPGTARLHIEYDGKISRKNSAGIFQLDDNGHWYVYTQFEATDARRAFPCFDQPSFKTPWDIALRVPGNQKAFANTPQTSSTNEPNGRKLVRFATTRPLPSYLVAFAVGPFDVVDAGHAGTNKTPLRIIVPKGRNEDAKFASSSIPELVDLLEKYFGMPFPYPKLDSVVMPISNFAMENAGLITYGADLLLAAPGKDTISRQRSCAIVTAHEMAHQWFGDLVTTDWWTDIWLNEAFATWMETKIVNQWRPSWDIDISAVQDKLDAMHLDRLASARKIRQPIESSSDIANAFDGITYQKGAAVINMFEHWLGEDKFREGVRLYIQEYKDKTASADQFLAALGKGAGQDISSAFSTFLNQPGVPVISAHLDCGEAQPRLNLTQSRYRPIGSPAPAGETWSIPVCVNYSADGETYHECSLLKQSLSAMTLAKAKSCPAWVDANAGSAGYYRVDYDRDAFAKLMGAQSKLSLAEKIELLNDLQALVLAGKTAPSMALTAVPEFAKDREREVVTGAQHIATLTIGNMVSDSALPLGRKFVHDNFAGRAEELGWKPKSSDSDDDELLRTHLVPFVAVYGDDADLKAKADELARAWLKDHSSLDREVAPEVLEVAARNGDAALFDQLLAAAKKSNESQERRMLLNALGSFTNPALAKRAMGLLLTGDFDMREAFQPLLFGPLDERSTRHLSFEFVKEHIDELLKALPREVGSDFAAALPEVSGGFCDARSRKEIVDFFGPRVKDYSGGERNYAQALEKIDLCIQQRAKLGPEIEKFLKTNESR